MKNLICYLALFISLSCICGMCNKDDDTPEDNQNNDDGYVEPFLWEDKQWFYMTSGSLPYFYGVDNKRPLSRKWIASKIGTAHTFESADSRQYFDVTFENNDKYTRFFSEKLNPGGRETFTIALFNFTKSPPKPGTFFMDIDGKEGYCWYDVYDANGNKTDSTRTPSFESSTFTVTKFVLARDDGGYSMYSMSGTADIKLMYWKSGTSSTTDIQNLQCTFNNITILFKD